MVATKGVPKVYYHVVWVRVSKFPGVTIQIFPGHIFLTQGV